jgi:hypothetical protein
MRFDSWNCERLDAARLNLLFFSPISFSSSTRARASSSSAMLIGASAGLVRLRGKQDVRKNASTSLLRTTPKLLAAGNLRVKAGLKFSFVDNLPLLPHIRSRLIDAKPWCRTQEVLRAPVSLTRFSGADSVRGFS